MSAAMSFGLAGLRSLIDPIELDEMSYLTGSEDGTARLWLLDLQDTIRAVCTTLTSDLTPEERTQFGISDQGPTCPAQ